MVPRLEEFALVTSQPVLAAEISSFVAHSGHYLAVFDEPRGPHPNSATIFQRTVNAIAEARLERIVLAGVATETAAMYSHRVPNGVLEQVEKASDLIASNATNEVLHWGKGNLGIGLLSAKQSGRRLVPDLQVTPDVKRISGTTGHFVICEDGPDLLPIIAANYAFAIGAGLQMVDPWDRVEASRIEEQFMAAGTTEGQFGSSEELRLHLARMAPEIELEGVNLITFFTRVPWGFVFGYIPSCHMPPNDISSLTILDAINVESRSARGTRSALLVDPAQVDSQDIGIAAKHLLRQGTFLRYLRDERATVAEVACHVQYFPHDFLLFSSHAGEAPGEQLVFRFVDSGGVEREVIVDSVLNLYWDSDIEMVRVEIFDTFVSVDGVSWVDTERKRELNLGAVIEEFTRLRHSEPRLQEVESRPISRVRFAMALKMYDGLYMPALHSMADGWHPIVMNNCCNSWHEMAMGFLFGGARAYLGSLFQVYNSDAIAFTSAFFRHSDSHSLAEAIHLAQDDVCGKGRRIYVLVGPHFCRIQPPQVDPVLSVVQSLQGASSSWAEMADKHFDDGVRENASRAARFCRKELARTLSWMREYMLPG